VTDRSPGHLPNRVSRSPEFVLGAAVALLVVGCGSDTLRPPDSSDGIVGTLVGPSPVTAAVLELRGVSELRLADGDAFVRRDGDLLRAVLVLFAPGELAFSVELSDPAAEPAVTVIEVADRDDRPVATPTDYSVRFGG
jgi:hypothetical protein